jgi:CMP/dCMP kinase
MPVVTISRYFGAGGGEVAERVAADLGWTLLDNAVVDAVAQRLGVPTAEVSALEERVPPLAARIARALALASPELPTELDDTPQLDEAAVIEVTDRVIEEAAAQGPVVVVGRGAQCLLAERADALHVLCHAPHDALVRRVAARRGISATEAERLVRDTNRQREQYVRRHWHRAWLDVRNYHLCVDTEFLGIHGAAALVVEVAREKLGVGA